MSDEQHHRTGAFFGRRKGHPLRERQAALMETLLPRLALDLSKPAPGNLRLFRCFRGTLKPSRRQRRCTRLAFAPNPSARNRAATRR